MKTMKIFCIVTLTVAFATMSFSAARNPYLSEVSVTVRGVDVNGSPVPEALIDMGFNPGRYDEKKQRDVDVIFNGVSDTNGAFSATSKILHPDVWFRVRKDGYYTSRGKHTFRRNRKTKKWDTPYATNIVVLKEIKNPIPMYVKRVNLGVPEYKTELGFDLDKGDWVAPYGSGIQTDMVVYAEDNNPDDVFNRDFRLTVTFPNEKDGIIDAGVSDPMFGSRLRSDYEVPLSGYEPQWVQVKHRTMHKIIENNRDYNRKYCQRSIRKNLWRFSRVYLLPESNPQRPQC